MLAVRALVRLEAPCKIVRASRSEPRHWSRRLGDIEERHAIQSVRTGYPKQRRIGGRHHRWLSKISDDRAEIPVQVRHSETESNARRARSDGLVYRRIVPARIRSDHEGSRCEFIV